MYNSFAVPLDYEDDGRVAMAGNTTIVLPIQKPQTAEEKRKCIKKLIDEIPTAKEELFTFPLQWKMVDAVRCCQICLPLHSFLSIAQLCPVLICTMDFRLVSFRQTIVLKLEVYVRCKVVTKSSFSSISLENLTTNKTQP